MQVFEFKKSIKNNPYALTTDSLTILFNRKETITNFKCLISECLPYDETITQSILFKISCSILHMDSSSDVEQDYLAEALFALYFLIENESSFPITITFLKFHELNREEMDYLNEHYPRFGITDEHISMYSDIAERYIAFDKYSSCPIVSVLQKELPFVHRVSATPNQFSYGKTDLVIKKYSFEKSYEYVINELEFHRKYSHPNILSILAYPISLK